MDNKTFTNGSTGKLGLIALSAQLLGACTSKETNKLRAIANAETKCGLKEKTLQNHYTMIMNNDKRLKIDRRDADGHTIYIGERPRWINDNQMECIKSISSKRGYRVESFTKDYTL